MTYDERGNKERVSSLRRRGVDAWGDHRVYVAEDVRPDAIEPGAVIRHGTLSGPKLRISSGAVIGASGHAEVADCQIGRNVELGAGLFHGATFLEGSKVRGWAEIRPHTLLEEQAEVAHSVALKNTTFTACCVAGSLINFCDLFLSGGRSRRDHTEIGSGVIHFNYDPRGDKWGSLIGGIRGVLMRSDPVFIGGHCGLVGPLEIGLGAVTAAGSMIRKDLGENELVAESGRRIRKRNYDTTVYGALNRQFLVTARLVGTLHALDAWYMQVRLPHGTSSEVKLYEAGQRRLRAQISERIRRLARIVDKLSRGQEGRHHSAASRSASLEHARLVGSWDAVRATLEQPDDPGGVPPPFAAAYARARKAGLGHLDSILEAGPQAGAAERWLEGLVDRLAERAASALSG